MKKECLTLSDLFDVEPKFSLDLKENRLEDLGAFINKELKKETAKCEKIAYGLKNASLPCDIYAEASDGTAVIVENQYNDSDYDHPGKIITYSIANSDCAKTICFEVLSYWEVYISDLHYSLFFSLLPLYRRGAGMRPRRYAPELCRITRRKACVLHFL